MSENAFWTIFWVCAMCLVGFVATQIKACEAEKPAIIQACLKTCGEGHVHKADQHNCECR
jgi:hypothetical protein